MWLKRHGYNTITQRQLFDALMCGHRLGRKPILITFDDGYRDAYRNASPVLQRLGMRATAYVITGRISNGDRSFLGWRHVRALERRGVEIGSHTVSHRALTGLSDSQAFTELAKSRRTLQRRLGHRVPWLAYPIGAYDSRIERLARRAGYVLAVTTEWGARQSARRPLSLDRFRILDSTGVRGLARSWPTSGSRPPREDGRRRAAAVRLLGSIFRQRDVLREPTGLEPVTSSVPRWRSPN